MENFTFFFACMLAGFFFEFTSAGNLFCNLAVIFIMVMNSLPSIGANSEDASCIQQREK